MRLEEAGEGVLHLRQLRRGRRGRRRLRAAARLHLSLSVPPREGGKRRGRRRLLVAVLLVIPGLLLALHSPPVRDLARRDLVERLAAEPGIDARIERLDYDLLRLRVQATGVRLAAARTPERPFLEARHLSIDLAASALRGALAFEELRIEDARLSLARDARGELNLPTTSPGEGSASAPPVLGRIEVAGLDIDWDDATTGFRVAVRQAQLSLPGASAEGELTVSHLEVEARGETMTGHASARLVLEGRRLSVRGLDLQTDRGELGGDVEVDLFGDDPRLRAETAGRLEARTLAPLVPGEWRPEGPIAFTASASGSRDAPRVDLAVRGDALVLGEAGPAALVAEVEHRTESSRLVSLDLAALGGQLRAEGELFWREGRPGRLAVDARGLALPRVARLAGVDPASALESRIDAELRLAWEGAAAPSTVGSLTLRVGTEPGAAALSGTARVDLEGTRFRAAADLDLAAAALRLEAGGDLDAAAVGRSSLQGRLDVALPELAKVPELLRGFGLDATPPETLSGRLALEATLDGTVGRPRLRGVAIGEDLRFAGVGPHRGRVEMALDADGLDIRRAALEDDANRVTASGRVAFDTGRMEARFTARLGDLPRLAAALPDAPRLDAGSAWIEGRVEGAVTDPALTSRVELGDLRGPAWSVSGSRLHVEKRGESTVLELLDLEGRIGHVPLRLAGAGRVTWTATGLGTDGLELLLGEASQLRVEGDLGGEGVSVTLRARAEDLQGTSPGESGLRVGGGVEAQLRARGTIDQVALDGRVDAPDLRLHVPDRSEPVRLGGTLRLGNGVLELESLEASWTGAHLGAEGRVPLRLAESWLPDSVTRALPAVEGHASLDATLGASPEAIALLSGTPVPADAGGELRARLRADAARLELGSLRARLDVERASLALPPARLELAGPAAAVLEGGALRLSGFTWHGPHGQLALSGGMALDAPRAEMGLRGDLDLKLFDAFFPMAAAGRLELDVSLETAFDGRAELLGGVAVHDGGFAMRDPALDVSALQARVELEEDRIRLRELSASVNGGTLEASGEVVLPGEGALALEARGRGLGLELYPDLRSEIDLDLTAEGSSEDTRVGGRVEVVHAEYRGPRSLYRVYSDLQARYAGDSREAAPLLERLGLDVTIASRHDAAWNNAFARLAAHIDLKLRGTAAAPALDGFVALRPGGDVVVGGTVVDVRAGSLDFAEATDLEPQIGFSASARVSSYDVELRATGVPGDMELNLASQPPLPESDLVALLATGASSTESESARAEVTSERAVATASRVALGSLTELLGVRRLRVSDAPISSFEARDEARLTLSVQLSRAFEVVHSQALSQTGQIAEGVIWHPLPRLDASLYAISNDWFLELQHRIELGRAGRATAPRPRETAPRVSAVDLRGAGDFETALRQRLRIGTWDRFDYFRWQEDRERLRRYLREHGHREARVQATRHPTDEGRVRLAFDVDPGPGTRLRIEGGGLDGSDRRRLEAAWTWAPSDRLLRADLERAARVALAREGYAQAAVESRVAVRNAPAPVKEVVIRVEPGERAHRREIVFPGARAVAPETLAAVVEAAGLGVRGFVERAVLESAITDHYATLGHLTARARAEPPEIDAGIARLEVRIDEGPAFRVGDVELGIPAPLREVAAPPELELAPGAEYRPAAEAASQLTLERHYRAQGFADARVETTRRVDPDAATVSLALDLSAGPRRIVEDVVFEGGVAPTSGVRRRLEEQAGAPASRAAWLPAQRDVLRRGLYRDVNVQFEPLGGTGSEERVRARVALEPWPGWGFEYGVRVEERATRSGRTTIPAARVSAERRHLFGLPLTGRVEGAVDLQLRGGLAELNLARFLGRDVLTRFYFLYADIDIDLDEIPDQAPGLTGADVVVQELVAEQRWRRGRREISYGYRLTDTDLTIAAESLSEPLVIGQRLARPNVALLLDHRDDPLDARHGWFHSSSGEFGFGAIGSDVDFAKYLGKVYGYRPTRGLVLAGGLRAGIGHGLGGLQNPINSLGFTAGGGTTVRGYQEDSLAPTNALGIRGGSALLILNAEARFPILSWLGGAAFVDAGNVWENVSDVSLSDLQLGLGGGLRLQLPILTLRLDLAFATPRRPGDPRYRFHFGIGQAF